VSNADVRAIIQQHARSVNGNLHRFLVKWSAIEPRGASTRARRLLAVDVYPDGSAGCWTTVNIFIDASTTREQLLDLLNIAFDEHAQQDDAKSSTAGDVGQRPTALVARSDSSTGAAEDLVGTSHAGTRR
jgi:hypothetical protein